MENIKEVVTRDTELLGLLDALMVKDSVIGKAIIDDLEIEYRSVIVTPDLAKILLGRNVSNRPLSKTNVRTLSREIEGDNWRFDGQPIRFNCLGELNDGQHRLESIIETNTTLILLVITGLEPSVFKTMDTGRKRTGSDALSIEEVKNCKLVSSTCKFVFGFRNNKYSENRNTNRTLSNAQLIDFYYDNENITQSVKFGMTLSKQGQKILTPTLLSGFHYLFAEVDKDMANDFITKMYLGVGLEADSPITALRNKLIKSKIDKNYKLANLDVIKNIVYAWNKFRSGEKVKNLRVSNNFVIEIN